MLRQAQPPCFGRAGSSRPAKRTEVGPLSIITQLNPNSTSPVPDQSPPDGPLTSLSPSPSPPPFLVDAKSIDSFGHSEQDPRPRPRPGPRRRPHSRRRRLSHLHPALIDPILSLCSLNLPFPSRVSDRQPTLRLRASLPCPLLFQPRQSIPLLFFFLSSHPHMHPSVLDSSSISSSLFKSWLGN